MRGLRFVLLAIALGAAALAQYIFVEQSLAGLLSWRVVGFVPSLARFAGWLPEDLFNLALWLTGGAALLFGLTTASWRGGPDEVRRPLGLGPGSAMGLLAAAGVAAAAAALLGRFAEGWPADAAALASMALALAAGFAWGGAARRMERGEPGLSTSGRLWLAALLLGSALLFLWRPLDIPAGIDRATVQAITTARNGWTDGLFAPTETGLPAILFGPVALGERLAGDPLLGARLAAAFFGVLAVAATWALGRELFRRTPAATAEGEVLEDDGGWMALVAALLFATLLPTFYFARAPLLLEPVALGLAAGWALLRGLRRQSPVLLAGSGILAGLAALHPAGLGFLGSLALWWAGAALLQPAWVRGGLGGAGASGFALWAVGAAAPLTALLGRWLATPGTWTAYLHAPAALDGAAAVQEGLGRAVIRSLLGLVATADHSATFGFAAPLLGVVAAPLFVLGIGAILLNLDHLTGWALAIWLGVGLVVAGALAPDTPFSPLLAPVLPAAALIVAFALDRLRLALLDSAGAWLEQATYAAVLGLIVWSGSAAWLSFMASAQHGVDAESGAARVVRSTPTDRPVVLVSAPSGPELRWESGPLSLYGAGEGAVRLAYGADALPQELPAGARLVVAPSDVAVEQVRMRYPSAPVHVERDLRANPVVYVFDLPQ